MQKAKRRELLSLSPRIQIYKVKMQGELINVSYQQLRSGASDCIDLLDAFCVSRGLVHSFLLPLLWNEGGH